MVSLAAAKRSYFDTKISILDAIDNLKSMITHKNHSFDGQVREGERKAAFRLNLEQGIHHVLLCTLLCGRFTPLSVLLDDAIQDGICLEVQPLHLGRQQEAEQPEERRRRVQVGQVESPRFFEPLHYQPQELLLILALAPNDGPRRDVVREHLKTAAKIHAMGCQHNGAHKFKHLILADVAEGLDALGTEELHHAHFAELAPAGAVGREDNAVGAVGDHLG